MIGRVLSHYKIVERLGAGGMGEVYKAEDTRLDRHVAIKVLPPHLSDNAERRERFEREARVISSLNHPHICILHDFDTQDGLDFLVMEYIEGETLADRLMKGSLSLDQALRYGIEIADALDKAHRAGVVHRDLKPGNMILTKSGAKLLDFGLAKFRGATQDEDLSALPTAQKPLTEKGAILGTFQYMSPEQLEGKDADARSDLFAFGAVLYEMVTGKRAFEGKSQASLISAIMKDEPQAISSSQPLTPPALEWTTKKCLAKDPDSRWQSAGDLHDELKWIAEGGSEADVPMPAVAPRRNLWKRALAAGVALSIAAAVAAVAVWSVMRSAPRPPTRLAITLPENDVLAINGLALSPDGRDLVYVGVRDGVQQLYRRPMGQLDASPIPGTDGAMTPFFSPDGEWVAFFADSELKKVPVQGGPAMTLCDVRDPHGGTWGSEGTIVISAEHNLHRISAGGGALQTVTSPPEDGEESLWPHFLPDGKAVLFTVWNGSLTNAQVAVRSLETGEQTLLVNGTFPRYAPTGHIVFAREVSLWAVPFDANRLEVTGSPTALVEGVRRGNIGLANFTHAVDGSLIYMPGELEFEGTLVWVYRNGVVEPLPAPPRAYITPRLSPDGKRLATIVAGAAGLWDTGDIWVYDTERGTSTRLTFTGDNRYPCWTPDAKRIAFASSRNGVQNIFWKAANETSEVEQLTTGELNRRHPDISPDGKLLAFHEYHPLRIQDIWVQPLDGERKAQPLLQTPFAEAVARFSPDGRWLAYVSDESGRNEIYVMSYPGPGGRWQISTTGGSGPVWARNGRELFYANGDQMMAVDITADEDFTAGNPKLLFEDRGMPLGAAANYDVSLDGERFVMVQPQPAGRQLNVVLNWFEELKRLVPTDN